MIISYVYLYLYTLKEENQVKRKLLTKTLYYAKEH
jgi:hypothetical protein